jgi:hypothetical protein
MYKAYKAYAGIFPPGNRTGVDKALDGINERGEIIVSVTSLADTPSVLIITQEPDLLEVQSSMSYQEFDGADGLIREHIIPDDIVDEVLKRLDNREKLRSNMKTNGTQ